MIGFEIDSVKVARINRRQSYIKRIADKDVMEQVEAGMLRATSDFSDVTKLEAVILCVPTPLNKNREPDVSFVLNSGMAIAPYLRKGILVVLESSTYPGTTDTVLREVLEEGSKLSAGLDFHLAFSPERADPGNPNSNVAADTENHWWVFTEMLS